MEQEDQKILKITKEDRIDRILNQVFTAHFDILIRTPKNPNIAVRGKAAFFDTVSVPQSLVINGLSEQGLRYLDDMDEIKVEFVGMATQIVFFSKRISSNNQF